MKHLILLFFLCLISTSAVEAQTHFQSPGGSVAYQVYPNPAVDYIQVSANSAIKTVALFNLAGRKIKNFTYRSNEKYFVGDLPKGMYLIQFVGSQNQRLATRRVHVH